MRACARLMVFSMSFSGSPHWNPNGGLIWSGTTFWVRPATANPRILQAMNTKISLQWGLLFGTNRRTSSTIIKFGSPANRSFSYCSHYRRETGFLYDSKRALLQESSRKFREKPSRRLNPPGLIARDSSSRVPVWQDLRCWRIRLRPSSETPEACGGIADSPKAEVINNLLGAGTNQFSIGSLRLLELSSILGKFPLNRLET